ncbi:MAG: DUF4157 domain-containing protein [Myxococcales bacterium]|nr:DUF4157 domain-containing protein [Myxococcales bacterium]
MAPRREPAPASDAGATRAAFASAVNAAIPGAPVQFERGARSELGGAEAHRVASHGVSGGGAALPHLDTIQRSFGKHDVTGVRAHVGGAATEASNALGANGYASGNSVAFAADPDLRLAAHEAAHVVQQRGGVRLSDGLGSSGDAYERHADEVAEAVVRGQSAESLLDPLSHRGTAGGSAVQLDRRGRGAADASTASEVITAPSDARTLLRYARHVRGHLHDPPGHLVPYARALDLQLMAGAFDENPEDVIAVVDALLAIRGALARRSPADLAAFRTSGSPLDGMIEDITPFGNVDQWHALRSAARARRRPRSTGGGTPVVDMEEEVVTGERPPTETVGVHAGMASSEHAGSEIAGGITAPHDASAGTAANVLDAVTMTYDGIEALVGGFEGFFGEVAAPVIMPIISGISLFLSMEDAWRSTREGRHAAGMRLAIVEIDGTWSPYPITLTTSMLAARVTGTDAYRHEIQFPSYETGGPGEAAALIRSGVADVARSVQTAVDRGEGWRGIQEALREATPDLQVRIRQDLRRTMYHRIAEAVRDRLGGS